MTLRLSAEEALLVTVATGRGRFPVDGALRWDALAGLADRHRLVPLLHDHLRAHPELEVPQAVRTSLHDAAREQAARALVLQAELDRVLARLGELEIPVVLLKGAALVGEVYPDAALRPMQDLDLLVPREHLEAAQGAVQALGYDVAGATLGRDDERHLAEMHHHYPLVKHGGSMMVELHHRPLFDRPDYDVEGVWARARPGERAQPCLLPAPEDLLLHVAAHFAFDRIWARAGALGQLADVARIVDALPIDWDVVVARARANDVADRLFLALYAADALAGDTAPAAVLEDLRPPSFEPALGEALVRQRVLATADALPLAALSGGVRSLFPKRTVLEHYARLDDTGPPSITRLRLRRYRSLARRLRDQVVAPRRLASDVRLSRWLTSLQR